MTKAVKSVTASGSSTTANTATSVVITWTTVGAQNYEVMRSANGTTFIPAGTTGGTTLTDSSAAANTAYLYKVRALDAATNAGPYSGVDLATTVIFTDDPLNAGATVKAVHITQLRTAVNAVHVLAGLGAAAFTDPTITVGVTPIRRVHIVDLRSALDTARGTIGLSSLIYTDPTITAGTTVIKAAHVTQLRGGTQ